MKKQFIIVCSIILGAIPVFSFTGRNEARNEKQSVHKIHSSIYFVPG